MPEENVEVVRAAIDSWNEGDLHALINGAASDFEYDISRGEGPWRGVHNLEETRQMLEELAELWESNIYEITEFIEVGDQIVGPFVNSLTGRNGIKVQARGAFVWTLRNRAVVRLCYFADVDQALEAAARR